MLIKEKKPGKKGAQDYGSGEPIEEIKKKWLNIRTPCGRYLKANTASIKQKRI